MASHGPIPKRSSERRRQNKDTGPIDTVLTDVDVEIPPCPAHLHSQARRWYRSLCKSAQTRFFQPSDWEQARILAIVLSQMLENDRGVGAEKFAAWCSATAELGCTEGARRRLRIEIERRPSVQSADVTEMDEYRRARQG